MTGIGSLIGGSLVGSGEFVQYSVESPFYALFDGTQDVITLVEVETTTKKAPWPTVVPTYRWLHNPGDVEWREDGSAYTGPSPLARLEQPWNYERQATGDDPFGSIPDSISYGSLKIRLEPADEQYYADEGQDIKLSNWNNANVTIKVGVAQFTYGEFEVVFDGNVKNAEWENGLLTLNIRDPDELLTEEIQKVKYGGAGGLDGTSSLKERAKPLLYGYGRNIAPVLIDPVFSVFQIHDGPIKSVDDLFDGGYPYGPADFDMAAYPGQDVYDWESIIAPATPQGGHWISDLANGIIRLTSHSQFTVTANAYGYDHGLRDYSANAAYVCEAILIDRIGVSPAAINGVLLLDDVIPYEVGLYIPAGGTTANAAIQGILSPLQCFLGYSKRGRYEFRAVRRGSSVGDIQPFEIHKIKRLSSSPEPASTVRMSWGHNWTVKSDDQLAANRDDEFAEFSEVADRFYKVSFGDISRSDREFDIMTALIHEGDAQTEAIRQSILMVGSDVYEITADHRILGFLPGDTVNVSYDGFGFESNPLYTLLSVRENGRTSTNVYRAWGNFSYYFG